MGLREEGVDSSAISGICHSFPVSGCLASPKLRRKAVGSRAPVRLHSRIGVARACAWESISWA